MHAGVASRRRRAEHVVKVKLNLRWWSVDCLICLAVVKFCLSSSVSFTLHVSHVRISRFWPYTALDGFIKRLDRAAAAARIPNVTMIIICA